VPILSNIFYRVLHSTIVVQNGLKNIASVNLTGCYGL